MIAIKFYNMKKLHFIIVFLSGLLAVNAQSVDVSYTGITPAPLQTVENLGTGIATFSFGDSSGLASHFVVGDSNISIDLNLLNIKLLSENTAFVSGTILDYFDVSYDAALKILTFSQKATYPALTVVYGEFPIQVSQDTSQAEVSNGFVATVSSSNPLIQTSGLNTSINTFTDTNAVAGPTAAAYESALAVDEEEIALPALSVYPNPVYDVVNIKLGTDTITKVELFDLLGKQLLAKKVDNLHAFELNIANFATSVYVLKVSTDKNSRSLKIFKN